MNLTIIYSCLKNIVNAFFIKFLNLNKISNIIIYECCRKSLAETFSNLFGYNVWFLYFHQNKNNILYLFYIWFNF